MFSRLPSTPCFHRPPMKRSEPSVVVCGLADITGSIDINRCTGGVFGQPCGKKQNHVGNILWLGNLTQARLCSSNLHSDLFDEYFVESGIDEAGSNSKC